MQTPLQVYIIYWIPNGVVFDLTISGGIGNLVGLTDNFFTELSGTPYLNIVSQYPESCGSNQCALQTAVGSVTVAGTYFDTSNYPNGAGTQSTPLKDADIQNEITKALLLQGWASRGLHNPLVLVVTGRFSSTGAPVAACDSQGSCGGFCGYHSSFPFANAGTIAYALLLDTTGCADIFPPVNGQLSTDELTIHMSHEFMEAVTDINGDAWYDDSNGYEIGDNCEAPVPVNLNGYPYAAQYIWSNASPGCVSGYLGPAAPMCTASTDCSGNMAITCTGEELTLQSRDGKCVDAYGSPILCTATPTLSNAVSVDWPGSLTAPNHATACASDGHLRNCIVITTAAPPGCPPLPSCKAATDCTGEVSISCTGEDVWVLFNGNCKRPDGEPAACVAGGNGASSVTAGGNVYWQGTTNQTNHVEACTMNNVGASCILVDAPSPTSCPPLPRPPTPICFSGLGAGEVWCPRYNRCVPANLCRVTPNQP